VEIDQGHLPLWTSTLFYLHLCRRVILDDLHQYLLFTIVPSQFRNCDYKYEPFEIGERTKQGRALLLRPLPLVWLYSPVHLQRAQVLAQKAGLGVVGCMVVSSQSTDVERANKQ
jgi:hypothetical protein